MHTTYEPRYLFIDGKWIAAQERETAPVIKPATKRERGRGPLATSVDSIKR